MTHVSFCPHNFVVECLISALRLGYLNGRRLVPSLSSILNYVLYLILIKPALSRTLFVGRLYHSKRMVECRVNKEMICNWSIFSKPKKILSSWEWDFDGSQAEYTALYPRSWTVFRIPDHAVTLICRQISPVTPHNYKVPHFFSFSAWRQLLCQLPIPPPKRFEYLSRLFFFSVVTLSSSRTERNKSKEKLPRRGKAFVRKNTWKSHSKEAGIINDLRVDLWCRFGDLNFQELKT